jgi:immune inhibitor A
MNKLHCVPPSPEMMSQLYADYLRADTGPNITFPQYLTSIGFTNPAANVHGMDDATFMRRSDDGLELISVPETQIQGPLRVKVLLIDFPDQEGVLPVSHYQQLLFSKDTHPTGSMRDYFREVTLGKVDVNGSIHGWLRMPNNYSFYTNGESGMKGNSYPRNAQRMAEDAVRTAREAGVAFEDELDVLNEGTVTALFIIHAGLGAETLNRTIGGRHIWSHKWGMRKPIEVANGLYATTYLTVPNDAKVGVCSHELGHLAFQWEDFYDPNYGQDGKEWDGSGSWDLMASGSYNGNGHRPCHPAALHKSQHNWVHVTEIRESGQFSLKPHTVTGGGILKLISPKYRTGQYLMLENRAKTGFDSDLPGEGLLVWKVDETASMFAPDKPALLLIQADGRRQLETPNDWNTGDAGDPFPGSANRTDLNDRGNISTSFPDGEDSGINLRNIQRNSVTGLVTLDVDFAADNAVTSEIVTGENRQSQAIPDDDTSGIESLIAINRDGFTRQLSVSVDISHTYIADLQVKLVAPSGQTIMLHNKEGGSADNLRKTYASSSHAALASLTGSAVGGNWALQVADLAGTDTGTLNNWSMAFEMDKADSVIRKQITPNKQIPDDEPAGIGSVIRIPRTGIAHSLTVNLDITHTYVGDLRVELINPQGQRALLHNRGGDSGDNLKTSITSSFSAALAALMGQAVNGDWTLRVADLAGQDKGKLNSWGLEIDLAAKTSLVEKENITALQIPDDDPAGIGSSLNFTETGTVQSVELVADISHTYIGDLRVELVSPSGQLAMLHNRAGGRIRDLQLQLNSAETTTLAALVGEPIQGNWVLRVADLEGQDVGTLNQWSLRLSYVE